ncbi:M48 family metallopeptidase [Jannaschia ovalis]|uniref:SprT family zinc-dependent metalloprotease n=1 Tax=Jannaschia ovalis TaxID=3038773 RepID=A0ABY8LI89_9RHOB|nr:SprT family zinc-dependent metalloprotease [Jannaschia sp. GRR-S6-38]WGH80100.1 SprT family zinc-dependent metalloprotease [Jannaschia sp. GRR-S6-38]
MRETDSLTVPGAPHIAVRLRRSSRARRMALRVGRSDGRVTLTLPPRMDLAEARDFVESQAGWIARQVAAVPAPLRVAVGGYLPLRGREVPLVAGSGRSARLRDGAIAVPDDARAGPRVKVLLAALARTHLAEAVDRHAGALGRVPGKLTLRDTRSRWGSCSSRGDLMFSWRLVMAPPEVLDYVAAHEVAHLRHMDHSPRFWAQVEALMPDWRPKRDWLRAEGARLHAIDFS